MEAGVGVGGDVGAGNGGNVDPGIDLEKLIPLSDSIFISVLRVRDAIASYVDMTVDEVRDHIARRCTWYTTTSTYPKYMGKEIAFLGRLRAEHLLFCYTGRTDRPNHLHASDQMKILKKMCREDFIIVKIVDGYTVDLNDGEKKMIARCNIKFDSSVDYDPLAPK
jgi:hypothetical protein